MATDGSELIFIRCPACRALVPASSSRCRMCGATLSVGAQGSSNEGDPKEDSSRVRQRTMSSGEISSIAHQVRRDSVASALLDTLGETDPSSSETPTEDEIQPSTSIPSQKSDELSDDLFGEDPDPLGEYIDEHVGSVLTTPEHQKHLESEEIHDTEDEDFDALDENDHDGEVPPLVNQKESMPELPPASPQMESPVVVPIPEMSKQEIVPQSDRTAELSPTIAASPHTESHATMIQQVAPPVSTAVMPEQMQTSAPAMIQPTAAVFSPAIVAPGARVSVGNAMQGRIFGWLVSFLNSREITRELREGKFFVSGTMIKQTDLVVQDASISSPHAMLAVTLTNGLQIQDLMSERGVFVRRNGQEAYNREEEMQKLDHGDWIRLGDVEFLVCLIPYPGVV